MKEKIGILEQKGLCGWRWQSMVKGNIGKDNKHYDLAREELGQVNITMYGFHLMEFPLYSKKKWLEENNHKYHYIYVSMLMRVIVK